MSSWLWCTCPRCYGKRWNDVAEYTAAHQGQDVRPHEVDIQSDDPYDELDEVLIFTGTSDGKAETLVQVYLGEGTAEVSYRKHRFDTWGVPTTVYAELREAASRSHHPSAHK